MPENLSIGIMTREKAVAEKLLAQAGITINGRDPWDIQVHDERFYKRVLTQGSLGLGESYMEKWWDCERVDLFLEKVLRANVRVKITASLVWLAIKALFSNRQSKERARQAIDVHYDLSNELYLSFLDPYVQYTCGYFENTDSLDEAQIKKMDLICRKLELKAGERLLDIGCGWGGLAKFAAEKYGCRVTGITLSEEQAKYAKENTRGLPVEIRIQDYRDLAGEQYDKIVSVGMFEHVGYKNYRQMMEKVHECLKGDGLFLLHTIGKDRSAIVTDPWIEKYIFPNGMIPSVKQIGAACERLFVMEDWHNFGPYYYRTLRAWDANFQKNWSTVKEKYSETFYRMFRYYFNICAGSFKARKLELWQIVLSKGARDTVYERPR